MRRILSALLLTTLLPLSACKTTPEPVAAEESEVKDIPEYTNKSSVFIAKVTGEDAAKLNRFLKNRGEGQARAFHVPGYAKILCKTAAECTIAMESKAPGRWAKVETDGVNKKTVVTMTMFKRELQEDKDGIAGLWTTACQDHLNAGSLRVFGIKGNNGNSFGLTCQFSEDGKYFQSFNMWLNLGNNSYVPDDSSPLP